MLNYNVAGAYSRGRPKKLWLDNIKNDMKSLKISAELAFDRHKGKKQPKRRHIHRTHPALVNGEERTENAWQGKVRFLHDQKFKTKISISWELKEILRWNKNYFSFLYYPCSSCKNLITVISTVLIGQYLNFCSLTSPACCNSPRKCMPVKWKMRQKTGCRFVT